MSKKKLVKELKETFGSKIDEPAKEEKIETKEDEIKKDEVKVERKLNIEEFLETNLKTRGSNNTYAAGFRIWWTKMAKRKLSERLFLNDWETQLKKYLSQEVN